MLTLVHGDLDGPWGHGKTTRLQMTVQRRAGSLVVLASPASTSIHVVNSMLGCTSVHAWVNMDAVTLMLCCR